MELYPILENRDAASANIWYVVTPQGPQVDGGVGTKCCAQGSKVMVCGGANPAGAFGNIYEVCLDRFKVRKLSSTVTPRYEHAMVLHDNQLTVYGGAGIEGNMNDVEVVNIVTDEKAEVSVDSTSAPCPRTIHNVASTNNTLYVWGGGGQGADPVTCTDTFSLDLGFHQWTKLPTIGTPPSPRHGHVLCCYNNSLYVHGGMAGEEFYDDMYCLDLGSCEWSKVEIAAHPSPRAAHISTLHNAKLYMFGGLSKDGALDDLWVFDCTSREWSEVKVAPPSPHPRLDHCMCVVTVPYCKDNVGNTSKVEVPLNKDGITDITEMLLTPETTEEETTQETTQEAADSDQTMLYMFGGMDTQGNIFNDMYLLLLED